jgi:hypothetical protein
MATNRDPQQSLLHTQGDRALLVKILAEMRVQTLLLAQAFNSQDDVAALRDEVMGNGNRTPSDL